MGPSTLAHEAISPTTCCNAGSVCYLDLCLETGLTWSICRVFLFFYFKAMGHGSQMSQVYLTAIFLVKAIVHGST